MLSGPHTLKSIGQACGAASSRARRCRRRKPRRASGRARCGRVQTRERRAYAPPRSAPCGACVADTQQTHHAQSGGGRCEPFAAELFERNHFILAPSARRGHTGARGRHWGDTGARGRPGPPGLYCKERFSAAESRESTHEVKGAVKRARTRPTVKHGLAQERAWPASAGARRVAGSRPRHRPRLQRQRVQHGGCAARLRAAVAPRGRRAGRRLLRAALGATASPRPARERPVLRRRAGLLTGPLPEMRRCWRHRARQARVLVQLPRRQAAQASHGGPSIAGHSAAPLRAGPDGTGARAAALERTHEGPCMRPAHLHVHPAQVSAGYCHTSMQACLHLYACSCTYPHP